MPKYLQERNDMKLYELTKGQQFVVADNKGRPIVLTFDHVDGMYSYCTDDENRVYHVAAFEDLEVWVH